MTDRSAHAIALLERIESDGHVREESAHQWADVMALAREGKRLAAVAGLLEMRERGELREEANERALEAVHELEAIGDDPPPAGEGEGDQAGAGEGNQGETSGAGEDDQAGDDPSES